MQEPGRTLLSARGDIDLATRDALTEIAVGALGKPAVREVVLDLGCVTFMDASGLGSLIAIRNASRTYGIALVLSAVPAGVVRLLELTDLLRFFTVSAAPGGAPQPRSDARPEGAK